MTKVIGTEGVTPFLQNHPLPPLCLIIAKESYDLSAALNLLLSQLDADASVSRFDGHKLKIGSVLDELNTLSFFGGSRVAVVSQLEKVTKDGLDALTEYVANPSPNSMLILSGTTLRSNTKLYKALDQGGLIIDFPELRPWEKERALPAWVTLRAKERGADFPLQAAQLLVRKGGTDKGILSQEIDKLIAAADGERITEALVEELALSVENHAIWDIKDAIYRHDAASASRMALDQLNNGAPLPVLLRQLRNQIQITLQVASVTAQGGGAHEVSQELPNLRGRSVEDQLTAARRLGYQRLKGSLLAIDKADLQSKNSIVPHDILLEQLLVKLSLKESQPTWA
jgi:DNA polymerase-3 subunit delta